MTVQDSYYVQSLTDYLNDIKPYHSKLLDVLVEYQYDDMFAVRAEDYLFTTAQLNSNWCQTHLLSGARTERDRTFNIPATVIPRLLSNNGQSKHTIYDALDFTGGEGYTTFPRPVITLVHPVSGVELTPTQLGDTSTVEHGIIAIVSQITVPMDIINGQATATSVATGGKITGFVIYNKKIWDFTGTDNADDPDFDSAAILTTIGTGLSFAPNVKITHKTGFGCKADCTLENGSVTQIVVRNQQNIADRDVYRISGQIDHRRLDKIIISNAGTGYTEAPMVVLYDSGKPGNPIISDARIEVFKRDYVTAITVSNASRAFATAPRVTIESPTTGITATAKVKLYYDNSSALPSYRVEAIDIVEPGSGYVTAPSIRIHSYLNRVELLTTGKGYEGDINGQVDVQVIDPSGVLSHPAVVKATVVNGAITGFTVVDGGESFTADNSTIIVQIPAPTGANGIQATARAVIHGLSHDVSDKIVLARCSIMDVTIANPGTGYTDIPFVGVTSNSIDSPIADISDTDTNPNNANSLPGQPEEDPYSAGGSGMECRALMTGIAPWDVGVKVRNVLMSQSRFKIGGPNNSLVQFNDGYAPTSADAEFEIESAILDNLEVYVNDKPISLRPSFNIILPNTNPSGGYGGSSMSPSIPEDIDDPTTLINPDYTNVLLDNYDTGGYDGLDTAGLGSSSRTEFFNGLLRVGTMYAPFTLPENDTGNYVFVFDEKWWMISTEINDKLRFCVGERENYNPEVLTNFVESFKISDSFYLFDHFGVSFSGQYVTGRDPYLANDIDSAHGTGPGGAAVGYAWTVDRDRQAPPNIDFWATYTGTTGVEHKAHQQLRMVKFEAMARAINAPNASTNPAVLEWKNYGSQIDLPEFITTVEAVYDANGVIISTNILTDGYALKADALTALSHTQILTFDGIKRTTYDPTGINAITNEIAPYTNTRNGVHDAEFMSLKITPPGYKILSGVNIFNPLTDIWGDKNHTWYYSSSSHNENVDVKLDEIDSMPNGYDSMWYDTHGYDEDKQLNQHIAIFRASPTDALSGQQTDDQPTANMSEDLMLISKTTLPAEFDIGGFDTGVFDYETIRYDVTVFKSVPPQDIVPGQIEISDIPLIVSVPHNTTAKSVTVRHDKQFRNNTMPTIIVEAWNPDTNSYQQLSSGAGYNAVTVQSSIGTVGNLVNDTFIVTMITPASVKISYLWY